jgi:hypothetical protein
MVDAGSGAQFFRAVHGVFVFFSSCALLLFGCGYAGTPPVPKVVVVISPASATVLAMTAARNERASCVPAPSDAAKKKRLPILGSRFCDARYENFYCVDRSICVMLIVLTLRSMGVCGGSKLGVKNCVSKAY